MPQYQLVRVVNVGEKDFVDRYNNEKFLIKAGSEAGTFVPWDAVVIWFGNPSAVNGERYAARNEELVRIQTRYGAFGDPSLWDENRPKVECYTSDNIRIYTAMEDEDGSLINIITSPDLSAEDQRTAEIATMQKAILELQTLLAVKQSTKESGEEAEDLQDDLPPDMPTTVPVGPSPTTSGAPLTLTMSNDLPEDSP